MPCCRVDFEGGMWSRNCAVCDLGALFDDTCFAKVSRTNSLHRMELECERYTLAIEEPAYITLFSAILALIRHANL